MSYSFQISSYKSVKHKTPLDKAMIWSDWCRFRWGVSGWDILSMASWMCPFFSVYILLHISSADVSCVAMMTLLHVLCNSGDSSVSRSCIEDQARPEVHREEADPGQTSSWWQGLASSSFHRRALRHVCPEMNPHRETDICSYCGSSWLFSCFRGATVWCCQWLWVPVWVDCPVGAEQHLPDSRNRSTLSLALCFWIVFPAGGFTRSVDSQKGDAFTRGYGQWHICQNFIFAVAFAHWRDRKHLVFLLYYLKIKVVKINVFNKVILIKQVLAWLINSRLFLSSHIGFSRSNS